MQTRAGRCPIERPAAVVAAVLACLLVASAGGCQGCRLQRPAIDDEQPPDQEQAEEPQPHFAISGPAMQPYDEASSHRHFVKPGHWTAAIQVMQANNFDFRGEIQSSATDLRGEPLGVEHTNYRLRLGRPAALPRGQPKEFEVAYYVPRPGSGAGRSIGLMSTLHAGATGREVARSLQPATAMPGYQHFLVVLAAEPDRFGYVRSLESVRLPHDEYLQLEPTVYYQVMLPRSDDRLPVPGHPLAWSTTAALLWDQLPPQLLLVEQREALLDWLHWGGQLMISGPGSIELLQGSFLEPYLPARKLRSVNLRQDDFQELNARFSLREAESRQRHDLHVVAEAGMVGLEWQPHEEATEIAGTGGLVVERRVGRGRVVMTAFPLWDRQVVNWGSFDSFFNAVLLRRPSRAYHVDDEHVLQLNWAQLRPHARDARLTTQLRYFARDAQLQRQHYQQVTGMQLGSIDAWLAASPAGEDGGGEPGRDGAGGWDVLLRGFAHSPETGVGSWSNASAAAQASRESLKEAAGITIPRSDFVLRVLAVYLLVLVPLNWAVFRAMGRVEWAWVAAPLIAVVGAVAVVRLAQLDIGFARSRTEIGVLELQPGYARGHLTRYTALYTSLSTGYQLTFADPSALAQPFAADPQFQRRAGDPSREALLRRGRDVRLDGFQVDSNTTGMVHSEQMIPVDGSLQLVELGPGRLALRNQTNLVVRDAGLLRRGDQGRPEVAWAGTLDPGAEVPIDFQAAPAGDWWLEEWARTAAMSVPGQQALGEVSLWRLLQLATRHLPPHPGETRLVGWTDHDFPGLVIQPEASQVMRRTLVLAHLTHARLPDPLPDLNLRVDVQDAEPIDQSQDFEVFGQP